MGISVLASLLMTETALATVASVWAGIGLGMQAALIMGSVTIGASVYALKSSQQQKTSSPAPQDRKTMIRSSICARTTVYGRCRVSGPIVFAGSTGDNHKYLHLVIVLAGHEIEAVDEVWFGDKLVELDDGGLVISEPYGLKKFVTQNYPFGAVDAAAGLGGNRIASVATDPGVYAWSPSLADDEEFDRFVSVYGVVPPPPFTDQVERSVLIAFTVEGATIHYTVPDGMGFSRVEVVYVAKKFTFTPYARVKIHLGSPDQAADSDLVSECAGLGWTVDHRLRGMAYLYVRLEYSTDVYISGIPNVSAVVRGKKLYDPRTGNTAYSSNWALVIRDYLTSQAGLGCSADEVDAAALIASADYSDLGARYQINGVVSTEQRPVDALGELLAAGAGMLVYSQGQYRILAGRPTDPVGSLDGSDLRGPLKIQARQSRSQLFNGVKAVYVSPTAGWQETELPPIVVAGYIEQDGGEEILADLRLNFTTNPHVAAHLANVHLRRSRQGIVVDAPLNLRGFKLAVGDVVGMNFPQLGWGVKPFMVETWRLAQDGRGVDCTLREYSASDFDHAAAVVADPEPDTTLPSPWAISAPEAPTMTESLYHTVGDQVRARVSVAWEPPSDGHPVEYQMAWWSATKPAQRRMTTAYTAADIDDVRPGLLFATVRARNAMGVWSEWSAASAVEAMGKTEPPPAPDYFTCEIAATSARVFRFGLYAPPLDLAGFQIRFNAGAAAAAWDDQEMVHQGTLRSAPYETGGFFDGEFTFTCRSVDTSGNLSTEGRSLTITLSPPLDSALLRSENAREGLWLG